MWGAIFPGQGSQAVGMGRFLYDHFALARETFEEAADTLRFDFKKLCFEGPEADLGLTENTQPALLLVSTAAFRVVSSTIGISIEAAAGHSVGEYAALVSAGALLFPDALKAVRVRGQAMQKAVPVGEGGMLAVMGLSESQVGRLCQWAETSSGFSPLEPANFNAPGQVVVSGSQKVIEWLKVNGKADVFAQETGQPEISRMKLIALSVSAPFHCRLMKPAEETMRQVLDDVYFRDSQWPIVQNLTAEPALEADMLRENLVRQVSGPVRWTQCMVRLKELGCTRVVEFGYGKVLASLAKKIDSNGPTPFNINDLEDLRKLEVAVRAAT